MKKYFNVIRQSTLFAEISEADVSSLLQCLPPLIRKLSIS